MADVPWYSNLLSAGLGAAITAGSTLLNDWRKDHAARKLKAEERAADKATELEKQDWYWRQEANAMIELKATAQQVQSPSSLCVALTAIGAFMKKNPALLRIPGNLDFYTAYCGSWVLSKLYLANEPLSDDEYVSLLRGVLDDLSKLVIPPLAVILQMEEQERTAIAKAFSPEKSPS